MPPAHLTGSSGLPSRTTSDTMRDFIVRIRQDTRSETELNLFRDSQIALVVDVMQKTIK